MRIFTRNKTIWVDFYKDGKRYRKSTKLEDTRQNRKKVERELFPLLENYSKSNTVAHYYSVMMNDKDVKHSTIERYHSIYTTHIEQFAERDIASFKVSELKRWIANMDNSPKTIRQNISVMKQIFDEAIYDEAIKVNPMLSIKKPKLVKYEPEPFSKIEIDLLLSNADGWFKNFLAMLFMTGMRIGELIALEWADIDSFICVSKSTRKGITTDTKTSTVRYIPIFETLKPYIKSQRLNSGLNKRVFQNVNSTDDLRKKWKQLLAKCEMDYRVLYQTRHTFAIHTLDSGMFKVSQIAKMLGHSSVQMLFQKYAKFIKSELDEIPTDFNIIGTNLGTKVV